VNVQVIIREAQSGVNQAWLRQRIVKIEFFCNDAKEERSMHRFLPF